MFRFTSLLLLCRPPPQLLSFFPLLSLPRSRILFETAQLCLSTYKQKASNFSSNSTQDPRKDRVMQEFEYEVLQGLIDENPKIEELSLLKKLLKDMQSWKEFPGLQISLRTFSLD